MDHVRRDQTHGLSAETLASPALPAAVLQGPEDVDGAATATTDGSAPQDGGKVPTLPLPYLFRNAAGLVRLTQQHNVRRFSLFPAQVFPVTPTLMFGLDLGTDHSSRSPSCTCPCLISFVRR